MSNGYFSYEKLESFLKDKKKINGINDNIKIINEDQKKYKLKIVDEKKPLDNINHEKINKELKNNINEKKENKKDKDTPNPNKSDNKPKTIKPDEYNKIINEILSKKETKLLTNSQYVSFENQIGDNSCYVNVIMHFLYLFPCVNDFLIKKY